MQAWRRSERTASFEAARVERAQVRNAAREERARRLAAIAEQRRRAQERADARATASGTAATGLNRLGDLAGRPHQEAARRRRLRRLGEQVRQRRTIFSPGEAAGASSGLSSEPELEPDIDKARMTLAERRRSREMARIVENPWAAFGLTETAGEEARAVSPREGRRGSRARPLNTRRGPPPAWAQEGQGTSAAAQNGSRRPNADKRPPEWERSRGPSGRVLNTDTLGTRRTTSIYFEPPRPATLKRADNPAPSSAEKRRLQGSGWTAEAASPEAAPVGAPGTAVEQARPCGQDRVGASEPRSPPALSHEELKILKAAVTKFVKKTLYKPLNEGQITNEQFKEAAKRCSRQSVARLMEDLERQKGQKLRLGDVVGGFLSTPPSGAQDSEAAANFPPRFVSGVFADLKDALGESAPQPPGWKESTGPEEARPTKKSKYF